MKTYKDFAKVYFCSDWLKVYDDNEKTVKFNAKKIKVYRAGDFGCIIQLLN